MFNSICFHNLLSHKILKPSAVLQVNAQIPAWGDFSDIRKYAARSRMPDSNGRDTGALEASVTSALLSSLHGMAKDTYVFT